VFPAFEESFMEDEVPSVTSLGAFIDESNASMEDLSADDAGACDIISFDKTEEIRKDLMQTYEQENNIEAENEAAEEESIVTIQMEAEEQKPRAEVPDLSSAKKDDSTSSWDDNEVSETIELFVKDNHEEADDVTFESPQFEMPEAAKNTDSNNRSKKDDDVVTDEYVTIKGITLARKKGNRLLSDYELEQEANFELQKRAFDKRAANLRSMSYDVNKIEGQQEDEEVPAYVRRNKELDNHAHSSDEEISGTSITEDKNSLNSNVSTLNNFLNGNNPD